MDAKTVEECKKIVGFVAQTAGDDDTMESARVIHVIMLLLNELAETGNWGKRG